MEIVVTVWGISFVLSVLVIAWIFSKVFKYIKDNF